MAVNFGRRARRRGDGGDFHHHGAMHDWQRATDGPGSICSCGLRRVKIRGHLRYRLDPQRRGAPYPLSSSKGDKRGSSVVPIGRKKDLQIWCGGYSAIDTCPPCDRYELNSYKARRSTT